MANLGRIQTLTAEVWDGADGFVIAKCLEIPGCASQGATRDEALVNLAGAIELCLDTMFEDWREKASETSQNTTMEAGRDRVPMDFVPPAVRPRSIA
jgi:predicted RNase H-like HicB family nuclease